MKLVVIANPVSGRGRAYKLIQDYARRWPHPQWEIELLTTRECGHAGVLAKELLVNPPDLVAICGGDGTLNEVASCVPNPPFPVAILPAGTANVVARELGLPLHPIRALQIALKRATRHVDLGELNQGERRFVFVAGIGFDAFVVSRVNPGLKARVGMAAYAAAIVDGLKNYSFPEFDVVTGGRKFRATSCLVCNSRKYGGGLLFCPDADMSDGLLDVLILEGAHRLGLARFLLKAWCGIPERSSWIHRLRCSTLKIDGNSDVLIQADGELAGALPVEIGLKNCTFPLVVK
jgi:diacylglycerol kinase (ATP)